MSSESVGFSKSRPTRTAIIPVDKLALGKLNDALEAGVEVRRDRVASVVAAHPSFTDGWAYLGRLTSDPLEAYAYFRVGYHRGLDALRASGWRGSGAVLWEHTSNRGFLRALDGLRSTAELLGESNEVERCRQFLTQCDPDRPEPLEWDL